jgi:M6 family metalloprotease-like protein
MVPMKAEFITQRNIIRRAWLCAGGLFVACLPVEPLFGGMSSTGTVHNLVILCRFPDHAEGSADVPAKEVYEARYNSAGGHPLFSPGGSVRDFFATNSYGGLCVTSTVVGWVTLPNPSTYYTQKDAKGGLPHWKEFHTNALAQIDADIDFKQFDGDKDGEVDSIAFIHSGGALYQNCAFSLGSRTYTSAEGTKVRYLVNLSSAWSMLGNICHEMTHQMRIADQYDTDHSSAGLGYHCLMAAGTKGWHVVRPHYASPPCAWCKIALGWAKPKLLENYGVYTVRSSLCYPDIFKITKGFPEGEYLLIENRQPLFAYTGPEVPKGGLAIWHIDEKKKNNNDEGYPGQEGWPQNGRHYKVALLQADGCYHLERRKNNGDAGDYYFGGHTNVVIGPGPGEYPKKAPFFPTTDAYQGGVIQRTPNQISHISPPGSEMTFTYEDPSAKTGNK